MRIVKNIPDVQRAITDLYTHIDRLNSKNLNLNGRKVQNASPATRKGEYVTLEQLPSVDVPKVIHRDQHFTIVFDKDGTVNDGDITPGYIFGFERMGVPYQFWVSCEAPPTSDDLTVNCRYTIYNPSDNTPTENNLLSDDLVLTKNTTLRVFSSKFASPIPFLGFGCKVNGLVVKGGGAAVVTMGLVIKRGTKDN